MHSFLSTHPPHRKNSPRSPDRLLAEWKIPKTVAVSFEHKDFFALGKSGGEDLYDLVYDYTSVQPVAYALRWHVAK